MVAKRREEDEFNRDMKLAWQVAALSRREKLPTLDSLLVGPKPTFTQQCEAVVGSLSAQLGIKTRKVRLVKREAA